MLPQIIAMTLKKFLHLNMTLKCMTLKYLTKINCYLFHVSACSLNKHLDDLQHLLSCDKNIFNIIAISERRIPKQVTIK